MYGVNIPIGIQGKNRWFSVHASELLLTGLEDSSALAVQTGQVYAPSFTRVPFHQAPSPGPKTFSYRSTNTQQACSEKQHARWFRDRCAGYLSLHRRYSIV
jgi:hypothetical protein